ncbi:hypothetical protein RBI94_02100 [Pseudomonas putida]|uniref:hypothetical protein n=1 Tax=Pseudomonas putida TaxID=303 RepID=UPI0027C68940|nr:hypothetical protein [Pseudomonas putida]MDQ2482813.1 hypothetical protein [Pseudomonas putida]
MAILVRKIERTKWVVSQETDYANADVLSLCLFTRNNELSFWRIPGEEAINEGIIAMVSGQDHIQRTHVVLLDEADLIGEDVAITESPGAAASPELAKMHRDLSRLTAKSMLSVSSLIVKAFKEKGKVRTLTESEVKKIMQKAFDDGRFDPDRLKPSVRKKLDKEYAARVALEA